MTQCTNAEGHPPDPAQDTLAGRRSFLLCCRSYRGIPVQHDTMRTYTVGYLLNVVHFYLEINASPQRSGEFRRVPSARMILLKHQLRLAEADIGKIRLCAPAHDTEARHIGVEVKETGKSVTVSSGTMRFQ